jgi:hypothetical protein
MNVLLIVVCPFVLFLLAIVLSVLRYTVSDCPFGIFKLFLYNKKQIVISVLNSYCREHLICYAFYGTDITAGAQYATITCSRYPGASVEYWEILFLMQYLNVILVDITK